MGANSVTVGRLGAFVHELRDDVAAGLFSGAQVAVWLDGEMVCDEAVGDCVPGQAMQRSTVHNVYCGLKPVVAMSLANVLEAHDLTEDVPLRVVLGDNELGSVTLADVLAHNAGLYRPVGYEYVFMSRADRAETLRPAALLRQRLADPSAYSEVAAWAIVAAAIEALAGRPAVEVVEQDLAALEIDDMWFRASSYDDPRVAAIGCYMAHPEDGSPMPLLHDRIEFLWNREYPCSIGGYASMRSLCQWYSRLLGVHAGRPRAGLPSVDLVRRWTAPQRPRSLDYTLNRECTFGYGFMTGLRDQNFGRAPSASSFGHAGYLGMSYAFADPERGLAIAMFTNGIRSDPRISAEFNRRRRISGIYRLLAPEDSDQ